MHPDTMDVQSTMFIPSSTVGVGTLCPDQRRVPQIGSLFAEIFVMPVLFVRLLISIVVASPVMIDLIAGKCYLDAKGHSLLSSCGSELFSMEDFFSSAYACSGYFWRAFAIIANFIAPGFVQTFINGLVSVGENSAAGAYIPAGVMAAMSKLSSNDPSESASKMQDLVSGGGRFGIFEIFMKTAINPIAGAHWIWRIGSGIVVQVIQASQKKRSIGSVFWNVLYDGRVDYKELIASRMFNVCGGMALMAGYTSPLGQMIYHVCFAGVKGTVATLDIVSIFFVDVPLIACVCRQSAGRNAATWIVENCDSPDGLKPLLRTIIDNPDSCGAILQETSANLTGVFDDVFGELFTGTTSMGSVLDSLIVSSGMSSTDCDNFDSNPYVVTLIPQPADYWRVCGSTDFCRLRCQQQIDAFESVQPSSAVSRSVSSVQTVQSLFFPTLTADAYNPFTQAVALVEMESCTEICAGSDENRCFVVAGFVGSVGQLKVAQYCVPSSVAHGVSKAGEWLTLGISGQSLDVQFVSVSSSGVGWLEVYCVIGIQDQKIQVCSNLQCSEFAPSDLPDTDVIGFDQMQSIGPTTVVQVRTVARGLQSYCMSFIPGGGGWTFTSCSGTNIWEWPFYHIVLTPGPVLLLPYDDVPLQVCSLTALNMVLSECSQFTGFDRQNVPVKTVFGPRISAFSRGSSPYMIFIVSGSASHWLTVLSVQTVGSTALGVVGNSMPVTFQYTLQQGCSLDSCVGCTQLSVQRLCFAAQQCQVARCVGSQVNMARPLCAVGGIMRSNSFAMLAAIQGVWSVISATLITVLDISGGISPPKTIAWPDQVFYGLVCSLKDSIASQVSVLTSTVNGVVQANVPAVQMQLQDTIDNRFLATFSMTLTAVTGFLYQLALAPLYAAIAVQKVVVCEANSLIGAVSGNNAVTIGDPTIQTSSSVAAGVCMSQVFTENAQGLNSGMDNDKALVSGSMQIISKIGGLALTLPLDAIKHPMDVVFTYLQGVILGLQDVLETADQKK